ncbi:MAG TPA: hypothetical protein ENJ82_17120, partial [Bacteroidetes bacterium]|nr:hypothetical protein [Bacteroidota bacterium]
NAAGNAATVVPGRNFPTQWTASNDAWRFVPAGPQNFTVSWFEVGNPNPISTSLTTQVCPQVSTNYFAQVTYTNCDNSTVTVRDTASIAVTAPVMQLNPTLVNPSCPGSSDGAITLAPTGGAAPYTYVWSPNVGNGPAITNLSAGTYTIMLTDNNNCMVVDSFILTDPPAIVISTSMTQPTCFGLMNGSATASGSGGTPPFTYLWQPGNIAGPTASNLGAATYTVFVTDSAGCIDSAMVTVTQPTALNATASSTLVTCFGGANGTATVTPSGGTINYTYSWNTSPVQTTATATNLSAGSYTVTVSDANLCTTTVTIVVSQSPPVLVQTALAQNVSCNGANDGSAVATVTGNTGPVTYSWNTVPVQTSDSAIGLPPGTWTVTVTDSLGCTGSASISIMEPSPLSITFDQIQNVSCFGANDGCVGITVSGGHGNYSYLWSTNATADSICNLAPGTYAVTVTDTFFPPNSQIIYFEDFDGLHNWTLNVSTGTNGADNNFWVVNDNEGGVPPPGCGTAANGDSTLHITSVANPNGGAAYDAGGLCGTLFCPETNMRAESPIISTVGRNNLSISFDFIGNGAALLDNASLVMNDGTGWQTIAPSLKSNVCVNFQGEWQAFNLALPASANNNPNLQVGINWTNNDDGMGTDPSIAINNIQIATLL